MKKTPVVPGKPVVMKTREDEEQLVMDWINMQSTYSDSIRYLIQREIAENGLRNLQGFIPQFRTIESLKSQLANVTTPPPMVQSIVEQQVTQMPVSPANLEREPVAPTKEKKQDAGVQTITTEQAVLEESSQLESNTGSNTPVTGSHASTYKKETVLPQQDGSDNDGPASNNERVQKRPAAKKFGADVAKSYAN